MANAIEEAITSEDVLGKDVIDSNGLFLGVSDKIYIEPKTLRVIGVSVDKGFLRKGMIIATPYIREVAKHAIFLNIQPLFLLKGKEVFDCHGGKVGNVTAVEAVRDTNSVVAIMVGRSRIPVRDIDMIGKNIMLAIPVKDVQVSAKAKK
jgi:sporulation protein YlmC with PRC-barrel domain